MYSRILVPLDGTFMEDQVLAKARALACGRDAELILLRVLTPQTPDPLFSAPWVQAVAEEQVESLKLVTKGGLERLARQLRTPGLRVTTRVCSGQPAEVILAYAEAERADAIVMLAYGVKGTEPWANGDVTAQVIRQAHVPVFLVSGAPNGASGFGREPARLQA